MLKINYLILTLFGKIRQEDQSRMINYLKCEANYISREGIYDILIDFQKQVKINSVFKNTNQEQIFQFAVEKLTRLNLLKNKQILNANEQNERGVLQLA